MDPKKILIAVDASDNAARAVTYVAELLGDSADFQITVLYIERPPNRDLYPDEASWIEAGQAQELRIRTFLQQAKSNLTGHGIPPDAVTISYVPHCQSPVNPAAQQCSIGTSIARDILQFQPSLEAGQGVAVQLLTWQLRRLGQQFQRGGGPRHGLGQLRQTQERRHGAAGQDVGADQLGGGQAAVHAQHGAISDDGDGLRPGQQ